MPIVPMSIRAGSQVARVGIIPPVDADPWLTLRLHEIAERDHRILNPFSPAKLHLLGEVCRFAPGDRLLDLCCGKGELLCTWSRDHGITGVGVDVSATFLAAAHARADELGVAGAIEFVEADASRYRPAETGFTAAACIGASWIAGGLAGTLALLDGLVADEGLILIGEPYWRVAPEPAWEASFGGGFATLAGTLDVFEAAGLDLVEMVLADGDDWDRYVAAQWWTCDVWLREHPDDPLRPAMEEFLAAARRTHLAFGREQFGWGVFVLRAGAD
jgi:hypothetical protein